MHCIIFISQKNELTLREDVPLQNPDLLAGFGSDLIVLLVVLDDVVITVVAVDVAVAVLPLPLDGRREGGEVARAARQELRELLPLSLARVADVGVAVALGRRRDHLRHRREAAHSERGKTINEL